jgi:hypothetical protein
MVPQGSPRARVRTPESSTRCLRSNSARRGKLTLSIPLDSGMALQRAIGDVGAGGREGSKFMKSKFEL